MPTQLALSFDVVPGACEIQQRYHSISPCLAGISAPAEQAQMLNLGYSTVTRWLREYREQGMPGLFPATQYPREPYKPERVIVQLICFKRCAPKAGDRELASGQFIIYCGAQLRPATTPIPSRYWRRRSAQFLEGFQESCQVGSFLGRENEAQMSLVVANHIFDRRGDSVVEVRRARRKGA
jgi:hypothetical protein